MSLTAIEFVASDCFEIKSEDIKSDVDQAEFNTANDNIGDERSLESRTKCGEIFTANNSYFTLVCSFCQSSYENIVEFGEHLREKHTDLADDGHDESWSYEDKGGTGGEEDDLNDNAFDDAKTESSEDAGVDCTHCKRKFHSNFARGRHTCKVRADLYPSCENTKKAEELLSDDRATVKKSNIGNFSCEYCSRGYRYRNHFMRHKCEKMLAQRKKSNAEDKDTLTATTPAENEYDPKSEQLDAKDESESVEALAINHSGNESDSTNEKSEDEFNDKKSKRRAKRTKIRYQVSKDVTNPDLYCEICNRQFKYKNIFKNHGMQHKVPPAVLRNDPDYLKCRFCGIKLLSNVEWFAHEKSHKEPTPYKCTYCPKSFKSRVEVEMHTNSHTGNRPFKCDKCEASFAHSNNLATHVKRVHLRLTPFSCSVCDKKFLRNVELRIHMRQHTGERPYQCEECGRSFMIAVQLNEHLKRHSNIRDIQCPECPMAFFTKKMLRKHMVKHSDERPHVCNVCGRTFSRKKALCVHYKIHQDVKEYVCSICGKAFAQPAGLYSHKKSHMHTTGSS